MKGFSHSMQLVFSADRDYLNYLLIALDSALRTTPIRPGVTILSTDFTAVEKQAVSKLATHYNTTASFPLISKRDHKKLPNLLHLSLNTYLRIYAADEMQHCERLLYLDCDLIVKRDLQQLWTTDMQDCAIGAAPMLNESYGTNFAIKHKLSMRHRYFNAGVLLINAKAWRKGNYTAQIFEWLNANRESLTFADQDALNAVFAGKTCPLSPTWNCEARLFFERQFPDPQDIHEIAEATSDPAVIHYTGPIKPWTERGFCPRREGFWQHAKEVGAITGRSTDGHLFSNRLSDQLRSKISLARIHASHSFRRWLTRN